jgi:hypothetical protein
MAETFPLRVRTRGIQFSDKDLNENERKVNTTGRWTPGRVRNLITRTTYAHPLEAAHEEGVLAEQFARAATLDVALGKAGMDRLDQLHQLGLSSIRCSSARCSRASSRS